MYRNMYRNNLLLVIKYLKGEIDIYNGKYNHVINTWEQAWDEIRFAGCNPQTAEGIQRYIESL